MIYPIHSLPHRFEIWQDDNIFTLTCGGHFVMSTSILDAIFVFYGKQLETAGR